MKQFNEFDVKNAYQMSDAIRDIKSMLLNLNTKKVRYKEQIIVPIGSGDIAMYFPANDLNEQFASVKSMVITNGKSTAHTLLTDLKTAEPVALVAATYLTQLRTGALSAIATDLLSRKDAKTLGVIGTGIMAFQQVLGVLEVRDIEKIILYNRTTIKAETFKIQLEDAGVEIPIDITKDVNELTKYSDIINTQTPSKKATFDDNYVQPGTHINGIGSFMPSTKEINIDTIKRSKYIIIDDIKGAEKSAGEFITAQKEGKFDFEDAIEIEDALTREFNRTDDDITIFKSIGAAHFDMAVAIGAYKKSH